MTALVMKDKGGVCSKETESEDNSLDLEGRGVPMECSSSSRGMILDGLSGDAHRTPFGWWTGVDYRTSLGRP